MLRFILALLFVWQAALVSAQTTAPAPDPAQAKPEKYGFKEIPFGAPKEAFVRVLCVRYGFKLFSSTRQKAFSELKEKELIAGDTFCYSKYLLGEREVEARWLFNKDGKFSQVQFRTAFDQTLAGQDSIRALVDFFNKMFETKYGPAAKMNSPEIASIAKNEIVPFWEWARPSVKIFTSVCLDAGRYYAAADLVDAR
jgi:hypothetical protein